MRLRTLFILTFLSSLLFYGLRYLYYTLISVISFAAGFMIFLPDVCWKSSKKYQCVRQELVQITDPPNIFLEKKTTYCVSGYKELDIVIDEIIDNIMRDYIFHWYSPLTNDTEFPKNVHHAFAHLLSACVQRIKSIDWMPFIIEGIPNIVIDHLRIYGRAIDMQQSASINSDCLKIFFDAETEAERYKCRQEVCLNSEKELVHFRRLTDLVLHEIMQREDFSVPLYRYLIREIVVNAVLVPMVNQLADPDFVNRTIVSFCNESARKSPYFIHSLRMSDSVDELNAVASKIRTAFDRLRGRDSGGNDDTFVKAQLSSLNFIGNVCTARIKSLDEGTHSKIQAVMSAESSSRVFDLSFDDVMENDFAVSNFLDFLTSINEQSLFSLYLNCVSFRVNAEALSSECSETLSSPTNDANSLFSLGHSGDERRLSEPGDLWKDSTSSQEETASPNNYPNLANNSIEALTENARAFGISMCNLILQNLRNIPEETVKQCLRNLTSETHSLDPYVFAGVEEELVRILSDDNCFGAFKRSPFYSRALSVMMESLEMPPDYLSKPSSPTSALLRRLGREELAKSPEQTLQPNTRQVNTPVPEQKFSGIHTTSSTSSLVQASPNSTSVHAATYSAYITDAEYVPDGYVQYNLEVICVSSVTGRRSKTKILRRYSDFNDLHSQITDQCGRIPILKLPMKKPFSNVNREFIERRRIELDAYVKNLCSLDETGAYTNLHQIVINFLQNDNWEKKKNPTSGVAASLVNPLKSMGSAMLTMPDTIFDGFSKMINRHNSINVNNRIRNQRSQIFDPQTSGFSLFGTMYDQLESDDIPFCILFALVEEVFQLQKKTQIFQRGILSILRNLVQTFFGDIVSRKIIDKANSMISANQMAVYAMMLKDAFWPRRSPSEANSDLQRDNEMKLRTRVLCRTVMLGSVAEELAQYLGTETTRSGVQRVFNLLQQPCLNRRLVHCLLEALLRQVLGDSSGQQLDTIYNQDNCPANTGRICLSHPRQL